MKKNFKYTFEIETCNFLPRVRNYIRISWQTHISYACGTPSQEEIEENFRDENVIRGLPAKRPLMRLWRRMTSRIGSFSLFFIVHTAVVFHFHFSPDPTRNSSKVMRKQWHAGIEDHRQSFTLYGSLSTPPPVVKAFRKYYLANSRSFKTSRRVYFGHKNRRKDIFPHENSFRRILSKKT